MIKKKNKVLYEWAACAHRVELRKSAQRYIRWDLRVEEHKYMGYYSARALASRVRRDL